MSELNINDLPLEILTKVFRCLDAENLKRATLTCQLWNNCIVSECRWSLGLFYSDNNKLWYNRVRSVQPMDDILMMKRKFQTIRIKGGCLAVDSQIHELFQSHGFNVVKLCCYGCRIDNIVTFAELLRLTPNVKHVKILGIHLSGVSDDVALGQVLPDLKKLTYLEVHARSGQQIIKCFRKAKLKAMKIRDDMPSVRYGPLVDFLSSQERLTSLTVHFGFTILEELGKLHSLIPFRLTRLIISKRYLTPSWLPIVDEKHLLRFVQSQTESLEELEMIANIPSAVYECVFASMRKLNTLSVRTDQVPQDYEFYKRLKENCSVHTVELLYGRVQPTRISNQSIRKFLKKLPNIRNLTVLCSVNRCTLPQHLRKLESLAILDIDCAIGWARFSNLKKLHIERLLGPIKWNEFTKIHSRLAELTIEWTYSWCLTSNDIDDITTNVDLQTMRLGIGFKADDRFFEIIRTKCTHLKVLDLHKSCLSDTLRENVGINVLRLYDKIK